jgi:hypothetical protein
MNQRKEVHARVSATSNIPDSETDSLKWMNLGPPPSLLLLLPQHPDVPLLLMSCSERIKASSSSLVSRAMNLQHPFRICGTDDNPATAVAIAV